LHFFGDVIEAAYDPIGLFASGVWSENQGAVSNRLGDFWRSQPADLTELAHQSNTPAAIGGSVLFKQPGAAAVELHKNGKAAHSINDRGLGDAALVQERFFLNVHINRIFPIDRHRLAAIGTRSDFHVQSKCARFFFATERFAARGCDERNECCEQIGIEAAYGSPHIAAKTTEQFDKVKRLYGKTVQQSGETTAARKLSQAQEAESKGTKGTVMRGAAVWSVERWSAGHGDLRISTVCRSSFIIEV